MSAQMLYDYSQQVDFQGLNVDYKNQELTHDESALETFQLALQLLYPRGE